MTIAVATSFAIDATMLNFDTKRPSEKKFRNVRRTKYEIFLEICDFPYKSRSTL